MIVRLLRLIRLSAGTRLALLCTVSLTVQPAQAQQGEVPDAGVRQPDRSTEVETQVVRPFQGTTPRISSPAAALDADGLADPEWWSILQTVNSELLAIKDRAEALEKELRRASAIVEKQIESCSSQINELEGTIKTLQDTNCRLADEIRSRPPQPAPIGFADLRAWGLMGLAFATGAAAAATARLVRPRRDPSTPHDRQRRSGPVKCESAPILKRFDLSLGNPVDEWLDLKSLADDTWRSLAIGTPWQDQWTSMARTAMEHAWSGSHQPSGRIAAADFAANVWAKFVSQFEPDRTTWTWTMDQCARAMPGGTRLEFGSVRPNDPYNQHSKVITHARGEGQFIAEVQFPGCRVTDADGRTLEESGAMIVKGDRL